MHRINMLNGGGQLVCARLKGVIPLEHHSHVEKDENAQASGGEGRTSYALFFQVAAAKSGISRSVHFQHVGSPIDLRWPEPRRYSGREQRDGIEE